MFSSIKHLSQAIGPVQISTRYISSTSILLSRASSPRNSKTPAAEPHQNVSNTTDKPLIFTRLGLLKSAPQLTSRELEARRRLFSLRTQRPTTTTPTPTVQTTLPHKPREISSAEAHNHLWKKFRSKWCRRLPPPNMVRIKARRIKKRHEHHRLKRKAILFERESLQTLSREERELCADLDRILQAALGEHPRDTLAERLRLARRAGWHGVADLLAGRPRPPPAST